MLRLELKHREEMLDVRAEQFNRDQTRINTQFRDRMSIIDQRLLQENRNVPTDDSVWNYIRQLSLEYERRRSGNQSPNNSGRPDGF